jgi:hypothetical protein
MYKVIDFYEPLSQAEAARCERGQMWWACYPYRLKKPEVTRFWRDRPMQKLDLRKFDPRRESRDDKNDTDADELLAIAKFKRRPVIILSTPGTRYVDREWNGGTFYLVAPVRSLRDLWTNEYRAIPQFVWGAITYQYSSVFYLPSSDEFEVHEAVAHFDWMTTLHRSWLLEPRAVRLSSDAMVCLDEWLRNYLYGEVRAKFNEDLKCYRGMIGNDPQIRTGLFGASLPLRQ